MTKKKQNKRGRPKGFKLPEKLQLMITVSPKAKDMLNELYGSALEGRVMEEDKTGEQ